MALNEEAVPLREGWNLYDRISNDPRVGFLNEPRDVEVRWRNYTDLSTLSPKISSDAYLAAVARTADLQLVTFDRGFSQFKHLNCIILE